MNDVLNISGQPISILELSAMLTGIVAVWLTVKQNIFCFPIGIINVILYAYLFYSPGVRLYADSGLQIIYIILLIIGWWNWSKKGNAKENTVFLTPRKTGISLTALVVIFSVLLGYILQKYTDASFPWFDAALTSLSLAAQWMIAKRYIENWILWIIADILYVPLYFIKGLPLTTLLYILFLFLAIKGYAEWLKIRRLHGN